MTKTKLNVFRRTLDSRQGEVAKGNRNRQGLVIGTSPDEQDRIQHASERDYAMGSLERDSNLLREVRDALRRIDAGEFGICAEWDPLCIVCQEADEKAPRSKIDTSLVMAA